MMNNDNVTLFYRPQLTGMAHIHVIDCLHRVTTYPVTDGMTIGRMAPGSEVNVQIDGKFISRKHGRFVQVNGQYYFEDTQSSNGTYINDVLHGRGSKSGKALENGDIIRIGNVNAKDFGEDPVIIIFDMEDIKNIKWERINISNMENEICIGRNSSANGSQLSNYVSRKHATFFRADSRMALKAHESVNPVYLNHKRVEKPCYLYYGDCISLAGHYFVYLGDSILYNSRVEVAKPANPPVRETPVNQKFHERNRVNVGPELCIYIEHRTVFSKFKRFTLLKDVHMTIENGEMVLILGGSGAGKTTFMNAVMGYEKAKGKITHGDKDLYADYETVKYDIGFVPQQDLLRLTDSVYDTLRNAAKMKLPAHIPHDEMTTRIEEVMEMLGLSREQHSLVQKLSGGQRKRLSIAVELISNPALFFLDEPDSGLDGIMARSLMENLRTIADQGKIVMVITHGPDRAVDLFDKVIVLAKSVEDNCGHLAFFGSVPQAFEFFECESLEGIVRRINRKDEGGDGLSDFFIKKYQKLTDMGE